MTTERCDSPQAEGAGAKPSTIWSGTDFVSQQDTPFTGKSPTLVRHRGGKSFANYSFKHYILVETKIIDRVGPEWDIEGLGPLLGFRCWLSFDANAIKTPILATLSAASGTVTCGGFLVEALTFSLTQPASSTSLLTEWLESERVPVSCPSQSVKAVVFPFPSSPDCFAHAWRHPSVWSPGWRENQLFVWSSSLPPVGTKIWMSLVVCTEATTLTSGPRVTVWISASLKKSRKQTLALQAQSLPEKKQCAKERQAIGLPRIQ